MDASTREELARRLQLDFAKKGLLCKLGWDAFQVGMMRCENPLNDRDAAMCRDAFYMGMQHLFSSIVQIMHSESEEDGIMVLNCVGNEIELFLKDFTTRYREVLEKTEKSKLS